MSKDILRIISKFVVIPVILIMLVDYFNIPTLSGVNTRAINYSVLGTVFNASVVIGLYIVTYLHIDRRQIQKDHNAKMVACVLLKSSYKKCIDNIELLGKQEVLEELIIPKVDFNKTDNDNPVSTNLKDYPFSEYQSILDLSINGILSGADIQKYTEIMDKYRNYVSFRITFYDIEKSTNPMHEELKNSINEKRNELVNSISLEIDRLQTVIKEERIN